MMGKIQKIESNNDETARWDENNTAYVTAQLSEVTDDDSARATTHNHATSTDLCSRALTKIQ